jgi:hypothetical protein
LSFVWINSEFARSENSPTLLARLRSQIFLMPALLQLATLPGFNIEMFNALFLYF